MEATETKRKGNPNFGRKKKEIDVNRKYYFKLTQESETAKGKDATTGEIYGSPFPEIRFITNEGIAKCPETGQLRRWRYVYGFPIWLDQQISPNLEPSQLQLEDQRNVLIFRNGIMTVEGNDESKLKAMMLNDAYEGNENPVTNKPKIYTMIDEDAELFKLEDEIDESYEALKYANESSLSDILPVAFALGIDVSDAENRKEKIRAEFKVKAKSMPSAFMSQVVNPINAVKHAVDAAMKKGRLEVVDTKITNAETKVPYFSVNPTGDVPEQVAKLVISGDEKATKLYESLKRLS